jgi:hypothetical protein
MLIDEAYAITLRRWLAYHGKVPAALVFKFKVSPTGLDSPALNLAAQCCGR